MKGHRLCVLPSWQGIGIGMKLFNYIAQLYVDKGWRFRITASSKSLYSSMIKSPLWRLDNYGLPTKQGRTSGRKDMVKLTNRYKFSFEYISPKRFHN